MCCKRYLSDEGMNVLIGKYWDEAKTHLGRDFSVDMSTVEITFLIIHIHGCHWGLSIFHVKNRDARFDNGYHCPINKEMQDKTRIILTSFQQATGLLCFEILSWSPVQRFKVPMPDQPSVIATSCKGTGSCGVGVVYCVRD